jgi:hypothetical protein
VSTRRGAALAIGVLGTVSHLSGQDPAALSKTYALSIQKVNEDHARRPGKTYEKDLAQRVPRASRAALDRLLALENSPKVLDALVACGEAALDLDLIDDFEKASGRLAKSSPAHAAKLGIALSRPRFLLRGLGGVEPRYLQEFADVLDAVLAGYDEVFGFVEWSKVPGKKIRVRIRIEKDESKPPHFAPQFPFHSEIDFPIQDGSAFRSPSPKGKFFFFGLCHELGHLIAMWGNNTKSHDDDHHAWADYTGFVIVEHLSKKELPALKQMADVRWRSLAKERERVRESKPSLESRDGVMALLLGLHDAVGPRTIGEAMNLLDRQNKRLRIKHVRYYTFRELREALIATATEKKAKEAVARLIPAGK